MYMNTIFAIFSFRMGYFSMSVWNKLHRLGRNRPWKAYGSEEGLVLGKRRATGAGRSTPPRMVWFETRIFFVKRNCEIDMSTVWFYDSMIEL